MNDDPHAGSAPSTRFVRYVLEQEGSLSRHDLEAKTGLSEASVARALATLQDDGVVHKQRRSDDPRKVLYQIA